MAHTLESLIPGVDSHWARFLGSTRHVSSMNTLCDRTKNWRYLEIESYDSFHQRGLVTLWIEFIKQVQFVQKHHGFVGANSLKIYSLGGKQLVSNLDIRQEECSLIPLNHLTLLKMDQQGFAIMIHFEDHREQKMGPAQIELWLHQLQDQNACICAGSESQMVYIIQLNSILVQC